eukprot:GILJ01010048.1.p1 GENE.GILJ01010048.1~~GILJ01010048.1.p1  ORF type:complete len:354 (+),score=38.23 GILJ01010048.1:99-1160(+)
MEAFTFACQEIDAQLKSFSAQADRCLQTMERQWKMLHTSIGEELSPPMPDRVHKISRRLKLVSAEELALGYKSPFLSGQYITKYQELKRQALDMPYKEHPTQKVQQLIQIPFSISAVSPPPPDLPYTSHTAKAPYVHTSHAANRLQRRQLIPPPSQALVQPLHQHIQMIQSNMRRESALKIQKAFRNYLYRRARRYRTGAIRIQQRYRIYRSKKLIRQLKKVYESAAVSIQSAFRVVLAKKKADSFRRFWRLYDKFVNQLRRKSIGRVFRGLRLNVGIRFEARRRLRIRRSKIQDISIVCSSHMNKPLFDPWGKLFPSEGKDVMASQWRKRRLKSHIFVAWLLFRPNSRSTRR